MSESERKNNRRVVQEHIRDGELQRPASHRPLQTVDEYSHIMDTVGNMALLRMARHGALQPKLNMGNPHDVYEEEADRVAKDVTCASSPVVPEEISNHSTEMISRQDGPNQFNEEEGRSYSEKESPTWAVPLKDRLTYYSDLGIFDDAGTGRTLDRQQMDEYVREAQEEKKFNEKLIVILQRKLVELDQLNPVELERQKGSQVVQDAVFEVLQMCVSLGVGGGTNVLSPYDKDFCGITINSRSNPFLLYPTWQHERTHQQHCLAAVNENKGLSKLESQVAATNKFMNARIWVASDIAAYRVSAEEIRKEIETYQNAQYAIIGNTPPMCISDKPTIQRKQNTDDCAHEREGQDGASSGGPSLESAIRTMEGGGQPLSQSLRSYFEPRFGYDFSQVRVQNDGRAAQMARAINAKAFTVGKDIFFGVSQYAPEEDDGKELLAHELTHVIQQKGAKKKGRVLRQDPALQDDADDDYGL